MRLRGRKRALAAVWALAGGGAGGGTGGPAAKGDGGWWGALAGTGVVGTRAQSMEGEVGRWAQSSALLSPPDHPTLLIVSGKTTVAGQTVDSIPSTSSALSLDLSSPITDLANPPWQDFTAGPTAAYGSLVPLSASAAMFYGGDATGDSSVPVQSGSDSSWLLSLSSSSSSTSPLSSSWTHPTSLWPSQPPRRSLPFTASATNGTLSRAWIFGGQKPDGSGTSYDELWEVQLAVDPLTGEADEGSAQWAKYEGENEGSPPAMWDGQAVLVPSSTSGALPSIYLIGGVQTTSAGSTSLVPLDSIWVFNPSSSRGGGSWSTLSASSGDVPQGRRGHVAVDIGDGKIWVQGGRGLGEGEVLGDAAVLDTRTGTWEKVEEGESAWGRSAVMVGETVVMAFGYGTNSALAPTLSIYSPSNDTWLDAYYPSYLAPPSSSSPSPTGSTPSNPKNGAGTSHSASAEGATPSSSSSSSSNGSSSSSSSSDSSSKSDSPSSGSSSGNKDSPSSPQWTAPGSAGTQPPSSSNPSGDNSSSSDKDPGSTSKGTIAGAVVGSLVGALALVAGGAFAVKRYRDQQRYNGAAGRFTGDDEYGLGGAGGGGGGGAGGLMAQQKAEGGYASSEMYNLGKALPSAPSSLGVAGGGAGGVLGALVGFLSPRPSERYASTNERSGMKRRFDMLRDEEEDSAVWDASVRSKGEWARFDDGDDEKADEGRVASLTGRGGMGIWDGFGNAGGKSMKSSTSYLGSALGGFMGLAGGTALTAQRRDEEKTAALDQQQQYSAVAHPSQQPYADPTLTPIVEWEEDDEDDDGTGTEVGAGDETRTYESHKTHSSATHHTASTGLTSAEGGAPQKQALSRSVGAGAAAALGASTSRPFSPVHSLYGSNFAPQPASSSFYAAGNALSRTSSATSSLVPQHHGGGEGRTRGHSSSWWSRLNLPSKSFGGEVPTPTAFEAIRDPAPAPSLSMDAIAQSDPFADAPSLSSHSHAHSAALISRGPSTSTRISTRPDEHGRFVDGVRLTHGEHDRSVSSNTSEVTATSSVLEERLRGMDVVERVRTGSGGDSSCEVTPTMSGNEEGTFGHLPSASTSYDDPFADPSSSSSAPPPVPSKPANYIPAAGSVVCAGSAIGAYSDVGSLRASTPPPVPPLPSVIPPTPTYGSHPAPSLPPSPRKKLLGPRPQPPPSPSSASAFSPPPVLVARSGSVKDLVAKIEGGGGAGGLQLPAAPQKTRVKGRKVEHGLARKPVLYVANPDDD